MAPEVIPDPIDDRRLVYAGASPARGADRTVRILQALTVAAFLLHLLLAFRPAEQMVSRPLLEDAFYSLSVSRSIGHRHGFTIDGATPTNGVQPLICLLYAPLFTIAGSDTTLALRLVLLLQVLLYTAAGFALAGWWRMIRKGRGDRRGNDRVEYWLIVSLFLWNYSLMTWIMNGLETSLALALLFSSATYYQNRIADDPGRSLWRSVMLGALLGLAVLARIDLALLVPAVLFCHFLQAHLHGRHLRGEERLAALRGVFVEALLIGGVALAVSSPWWIYNYLTFGSLLPISGQAQQMLNTDRAENLRATLAVVSDAFYPNLHLPLRYQSRWWFVGLFVAAAGMVMLWTTGFWRRRRAGVARALRTGWLWQRPLPVALLTLSLAIFYSFFFGAPHFQSRYLVVLRLLIFVTIILILLALYREGGRWKRLLPVALGLYIATSGVGLYRSFSWSAVEGNIYTVASEWISANVAPGEKVGMFQSGTTGFLHRNVENLDGKVNARALAATRRGELARYVDSAAFDYIIDWDSFTRPLLADPALVSRYAPVDTLPYAFVVWRRIR